jgi:hypothetical protein
MYISYCLFAFASYYNLETLQDDDSRYCELVLYGLIILCTAVNFNSFMANVILFTPSILIPYYLVLKKSQRLFDIESNDILSRFQSMAFYTMVA